MTDAELDAIQRRVDAASKGPWRSFVEGRDHTCGDDFIQIGDDDREADMYVFRHYDLPRGLTPAGAEDLDFIAAARQDIPRLMAEIKRLRRELEHRT